MTNQGGFGRPTLAKGRRMSLTPHFITGASTAFVLWHLNLEKGGTWF